MRLGTRDAIATLFVVAGVLAALSVTSGWGWPLMSGVRTGIIVLGLAGMVACSVSGWGGEVAAGKAAWTDPFIILAIVLGVATLAVGIVGLIANSIVYLTALIVGVVGLWVLTLGHRLLAGTSGRPATAA